ncbi:MULTISPECIES: GNAT family N-acetyltransferase [Cellulomonas]|uniref:GNAT family N-acetyltransferase n=1 Tax=Cellulomonas TaxID=1707 RepID=UPI0010A87E2F|nr:MULTISPECIES: GNAT family N-acetyltransferase [Cellulomonas]
MRPGIIVRPAQADDLDALVDLCLEARAEAGVGAQLCTDDRGRLREQLAVLGGADGGRVLVATCDGAPAGLLLCRLVGPGLFTDAVVLGIEAVFVRPGVRRRGIGHALLQEATSWAETAGASEVYAAPLPGARGMQRFLARVGFAPAAAHRHVTTAALQRRLAQDAGGLAVVRAGAAARGLGDLIERRRRARERAAAEPQGDLRQVRSMSMHVNRAVQTRRPSSSSTTTS